MMAAYQVGGLTMSKEFKMTLIPKGAVAQWCNPLTLQPEQSGGVGLKPGRAPPFEHHDKETWTRLALRYFSHPSAWR